MTLVGAPPPIATARLLLVPFGSEDAAELLALWNEPFVRRFLWDDAPVPPEAVQDQIAASDAGFRERGAGHFTIRLGETPKAVIGFAGLRPAGDPPELELLYALRPAYCGRGLATEAAAALLSYAFDRLGFPAVVAGADPPNTPSFRVMERLGMRPWRELAVIGRLVPYYRIERAEFMARRTGSRLSG